MALLTGQTNNATQNAIFGQNDATAAPTGSGVHGAGVFGLTFCPGAAGVFGSNNSTKGVGVQGNGPESGLRGFSDKGSGATAQSNNGSGLIATSGEGNGDEAFTVNDAAGSATAATFAGLFNG